MDNKKVYSIVINGISESASAVESLNKQLDDLDKRIKELGSKNIKIDGGSVDNSAIKEQVAKQKELNQLKKEEAAQQRLIAGEYDNTMKGMKQNLADLKTVINATDLGDSDSIKNMTKDANALTNKLKEMEQAYGQFGRNVGNYANGVAEGMQKVTITVGGVERTFNNAKEASRTLGNELKTMAINGQQGTKAFKDMQVAVAKLNSDIKDATVSSRAMDNLLDTMQSFAAIGSVTQGVSALFGIDNTEIERSIQKLVALQNVMQGIEKINQQINSQEGIGGWLAKGNSMIDSFVAKITGAAKAQETLNTATKAGAVASEGLAVAQEAQATATARATVATKALSVALKSIGIGLVVAAVAYLVENWEDLYDTLTDTIPALKNLGNWFDKIKAIVMGVGSAVVNYLVQPLATAAKTIQAIISGNFSDIPKIISDGFKQTFNVVGNFQKGYNKEMERQQKVHNNKMLKQQKEANDEWLADQEAKYGKSYENTKKYLNQQMELVKKQLANTKKGSKEYDALLKEQKELQRKNWENERTEREKTTKKAKQDDEKRKKYEVEVEKEMYQLRLNAMKEGLNKTIIQLEEERKRRLAKLRENGQYYKNEEAEVNKIIDQQILDAKEEWAKKVEEVYKDMWDRINDSSLENARKITKIAEDAINIQRYNIEESANKFFNQSIGSYGIQGKNQLSPSTQFSLGIASVNDSEFMSEMKGYIDLMRELQTVQNEYNASYHEFNNEFNSLSEEQRGRLNVNLDLQKNYWEELKKQVDDYEAFLKEKYGDENFNGAKQVLIEESYSSSLALQFDQRISAIEAYWAKRKKEEAKNARELYKQQLDEAEKAYKKESGATWDNYQNQLKQADKFYKDKLALINQNEKDKTISAEEAELERRDLEAEYNKAAKEMFKNYLVSDEALRIEHNQKVTQLEQNKNDKLKSVNAEYYQAALQELRDFQTAQSNLEAKQPVINSLGITNLKKTNENYRNLLAAYETMANKIMEKRKQVNQDYQEGIIGKNVFDSTIRELDNFSANLGEKMDEVKQKLSLTSQFQTIVNDINQYMQQLGQGLNSMLSSLADYQDQLAQNTIDALEEEIDKQEDLLDKQKDIVESHKDAIDAIEDELATSRGDRRQHLIDQLNAEMEAQRREFEQQKKIEKEKQALEDKKKTEEKKRNEQQKKIAKTQAIISGALAISNALAVQPFWVGLAMAAMAAAASAIQIATIDAQKFASGGVIQGKSHAQGGVKVLGGTAEVEGGEFITNKQTTSKNVDLLDYINSKHRKLNINDFIDFYSKDVKKSIASSSPRSKFADGGIIPTLNNEYQFDDRLLSAFEDYANRPYVVSVVDINSRQAAVKNVQVLAGLGE